MEKLRFVFLFVLILFLVSWNKNTGYSELLSYLDAKGNKKAVKTQRDWRQKRQQILAGMQKAMGSIPSRANLPALDIKTLDSLKTDTYTRYNITFSVAPNERLPAYLYVPLQQGKKKKLAAMLVLHGTGAFGKQLVDDKSTRPGRAQAKELAQRGYVVIAPDYPSFGNLSNYNFTQDRYESGTMKGIVNHMRCVDLLQARKDVDPERIGVLGHSLGGHNAMFVGAFDTRLKVIVASCGWTPFAYYNIGEEGSKKFGGRLGPWAQDRYMPWLREKYNLETNQIPFDFPEVIGALAPRAFFSNSPLQDTNFDVNGVKKGMEAASQVYQFFKVPNQIQVRYPQAGHDFPTAVRLEAYIFLDKQLRHSPNPQILE